MFRSIPILIVLLGIPLIVATPAEAGRFEVSSPEEEAKIVSEIRAAHFLTQATFGPTLEEIQELGGQIRSRGYKRALSEWIDAQLELPPTKQVDTFLRMLRENGYPNFHREPPQNVPSRRLRADAWWHNSITAEDQLRQRMAWALSQIFVVNDDTGFNSTRMEPSGLPRCAGYSHYYDMFVEQADGNYRELLESVSTHPIMGFFLTHLNNRKADPDNGIYPDENYARECMQLFTLGLYKVKDASGEYARDGDGNLIPTYDNNDISTMARVFTGWTFSNGSSTFGGQAVYTRAMRHDNRQHDRDEKVLLDGTVLPRRRSAQTDLDGALDMLFRQPETAPFVSRLLIQRMTHSNPSRAYIRSVATKFDGRGRIQRGSLKHVLKAILLHNEATGLRIKRIRDEKYNVIAVEANGRRNAHTSLREPVIRLTHLVRALEGTSAASDDRFHLGDLTDELNQTPFRSPSVFNFYLPDHQPAGPLAESGLVAPEFEILTSVSVNKMHNLFRDTVRNRRLRTANLRGRNMDVRLSLDAIYRISQETDGRGFRDEGIDDLLEYLDLVFCQGTMSESTKSNIRSAVKRHVRTSSNRTSRRAAAQSIVALVLTSPDCAIIE